MGADNYNKAVAYEKLGDTFFDENVNKAFLCYEMAKFYYDLCNGERADLKNNLNGDSDNNLSTEESGKMRKCRLSKDFKVSPVSIVILSYNNKDITIDCIESIRRTNPADSYELVVVDNASTDEVVEYLQKQEDIVLILNKENRGFAAGCNQGVLAAKKDNDIFFLNNDTILCDDSLFWLRMGLYEEADVGAAGSISNDAGNCQRLEKPYTSKEEWLDFGNSNNVYMDNPYEEKLFLIGFAMLVKRCVLDKVGLFDVSFAIGNYEDTDLGIRIFDAGYKLLLCYNSFIFHYGKMGFKQRSESYTAIMSDNLKIFIDKWGFDAGKYNVPDYDLLSLIEEKKDKPLRILEIGCGIGTNLARLKHMYPKAYVEGYEENKIIVSKAQKTRNVHRAFYEDVCIGGGIKAEYVDGFEDGNDFEKNFGEREKEKFDYIILGEVTSKICNIEDLLIQLQGYLKSDGAFILSFSNIMHGSVVLPLLNGDVSYSDTGIINKDAKRYYTLKSVLELMKNCGLKADNLIGIRGCEEEFTKNAALWNYLKDGLGDDFEQQCVTNRFIVKAVL